MTIHYHPVAKSSEPPRTDPRRPPAVAVLPAPRPFAGPPPFPTSAAFSSPPPFPEAPSPGALRAPYRNGLKRAFDLALTLLLLPVVLLPLLLVGLLVARDGGQPFYGQLRVGKDGRPFTMWKLRTMVPGAEALLEAQLAADPAARAEWARLQKLRDDPRITPIGRLLRRSSFDELPQIWNVLRGDMSLVGPRPMMPAQQPLYPGSAYYRLRPGLSGFWQISDRNQSSFIARARFDAEYDDALSFGTDLRVLWRTVGVVIRGTGW